MTQIYVVGVPQTLAVFAATAIAGEAASAAYAASLAENIATLARNLAPFGSEDTGSGKPGTLRESIAAEGNRVVVTAPYAGFVEYGAEGNNTPAQPYLRPAVEAVDDKSSIAAAVAILGRGVGSKVGGLLGRVLR